MCCSNSTLRTQKEVSFSNSCGYHMGRNTCDRLSCKQNSFLYYLRLAGQEYRGHLTGSKIIIIEESKISNKWNICIKVFTKLQALFMLGWKVITSHYSVHVIYEFTLMSLLLILKVCYCAGSVTPEFVQLHFKMRGMCQHCFQY